MRLRIVVAGAVAVATACTTAFATSPAASSVAPKVSRPASFCGTAQQISGRLADLNASDFNSAEDIKSAYDQGLTLVKQLQVEAPKSLKQAFKRLRSFYERVVNGKLAIDFTDEKSVEKFSREAEKAGKDVTKIGTYIRKKCKISFPAETTPTS